ncbi:multiubiquitin domain-containing protein [uncultured Hymenobacter sp.]|uniref:multiubiquitin domain-containing protein n=1 Tax=uncultured Hymenobacter sp. TaxID=170016 RepID=UPI0035CB3373
MHFPISRPNQTLVSVTRMLLRRTRLTVAAHTNPSKALDSQHIREKKAYALIIDHISFQHPDSLITGREIRTLSNMANTAEIWLKGPTHGSDLRVGDGDIVALSTESAERFFSVAKPTAKSSEAFFS